MTDCKSRRLNEDATWASSLPGSQVSIAPLDPSLSLFPPFDVMRPLVTTTHHLHVYIILGG